VHSGVLWGVNSDERVANRDFRGSGWEVAHAAVTRRPPIPLDTIVPRARGLLVRRWGLGFVHRSRTILCRAVPNLRVAVRNFPIAVRSGTNGVANGRR
jgi:hypothetical protein